MSFPDPAQIDNTVEVVDTRDIEARIDWLTGNCDAEEALELRDLLAVKAEVEGVSVEWLDGTALIAESYFETYAQQLADEIGAVPDNLCWPISCIDWELAARELEQDYTVVDFAGETYLVCPS